MLLGTAYSVRYVWNQAHIEEEDLYGRWVAEYKDGKETIVLNPDHTFVQLVDFEDGVESKWNDGRWEFSDGNYWTTPGHTVTLHDCWNVADFDGHLNPHMETERFVCVLTVEWRTLFILPPLVMNPASQYQLVKQ